MRIDEATPAPHGVDLFLFAIAPRLIEEADAAGIDGFIVDWERRGKLRRQAGEGTQINQDTLADLERVRRTTGRRVICRLNGFGAWTGQEVHQAVQAGADELLLPMVRDTDEVDRTLDLIDGRCGLGILVETRQGVDAVPLLATRPLSRVYVGLNDLRIDRGSDQLFEPLVDGTVSRIGRAVAGPAFGVAGLTTPDRGDPVPSRLLAAELVRLRADFTFLRRSFLTDTGGHDLGPAVQAIRTLLSTLQTRGRAEIAADRYELVDLVRRASRRPA